MRQLTTTCVLWCLMAATGFARDIYVDNTLGDDRYDGTAAALIGNAVGPYRTITRALKAAVKGDRIIVANTGQPYRESITLQGGRHSGIVPERGGAVAYFELIGNDAVLDGTSRVPAEGWSHFAGAVFRYRPPKMSFQVLYLDGKPASQRLVTDERRLPELQPLEWCLLDGYIYFRVEPNRLPQSYELAYAGLDVGITLYEVRHVKIRNLVVQGFQLDGVNAHDGAVGAELIGLNCRGNGRSGISVGGASRVRIEACQVENNGAAQVRTEGFSRTQLVGCNLVDATAPKIVSDGGVVDVKD